MAENVGWKSGKPSFVANWWTPGGPELALQKGRCREWNSRNGDSRGGKMRTARLRDLAGVSHFCFCLRMPLGERDAE